MCNSSDAVLAASVSLTAARVLSQTGDHRNALSLLRRALLNIEEERAVRVDIALHQPGNITHPLYTKYIFTIPPSAHTPCQSTLLSIHLINPPDQPTPSFHPLITPPYPAPSPLSHSLPPPPPPLITFSPLDDPRDVTALQRLSFPPPPLSLPHPTHPPPPALITPHPPHLPSTPPPSHHPP